MPILAISPSSGSGPAGTHLVAGFGRILDLKPEQFLTDVSDAAALIEAEQGAIEHMNEDHREAMNLYATKLLGAESADWRCTGCDPEGMDMQAGQATLRLDFPARVTGPGRLAQDAGPACERGAGEGVKPPPAIERARGLAAT